MTYNEGAVAKGLARQTPKRAVLVRPLAGVITICQLSYMLKSILRSIPLRKLFMRLQIVTSPLVWADPFVFLRRIFATSCELHGNSSWDKIL